MMSLNLIAEQIKKLKDNRNTSINPLGMCHEVAQVLESMMIVLQQHEALLLYAHKTLNLDYHRRADELFKKFNKSVAEDREKVGLSADERLARVKRFAREHQEARAKLDKEFNIVKEAS